MENADLRSICGGTAVATQSFPCTVHESDGSVHTKEVSSVEECLEPQIRNLLGFVGFCL